MTWRISVPEDDDAIVNLSLALYREDPSPRPVPAEHTRATLARFRAEPVRGCAVVLVLAGKVEGYALLASFWSNEVGGEICTVDEFYVTPGSRGAGQGRALLKSLQVGGQLWPTSVAVDLEVTPDNARARKFYESLGFKPAKNAHLRFRP
ncbi:MAG: N-acetyltransferase family protein [Bdellovibrionota bacterium]